MRLPDCRKKDSESHGQVAQLYLLVNGKCCLHYHNEVLRWMEGGQILILFCIAESISVWNVCMVHAHAARDLIRLESGAEAEDLD